ncbi:hypothetical protein OS493_016442 [Desmophyllum pertusum]|uniref:Uncharacterized protein n=1 Tax=Desmophyllum pertusum TaxID=174260 RepID=A0A9X0D307_9CNID|nr:hypothetical protein OS493_016442 [Desmophyllum pertusum]
MSIAQTAMIMFVNWLNKKEELPGIWLHGLFLLQIPTRKKKIFEDTFYLSE